MQHYREYQFVGHSSFLKVPKTQRHNEEPILLNEFGSLWSDAVTENPVKPSDARHGVFFPGIDVVSSWKLRFFGLPCKQIILDIAPVFLPDHVTDN